jgi:hypothetical protein
MEVRECIQKFPDWVGKEIYIYLGITRWEATQRVMTAKRTRLTHKIAIINAPSGREQYHLQFSLQAVSPETFGYTFVDLVFSIQIVTNFRDNFATSRMEARDGVRRGDKPYFELLNRIFFVNILNKQSRTADKWRFSNKGFGKGANNSSPHKYSMLLKLQRAFVRTLLNTAINLRA